MSRRRVIIVGGGFGGVTLAQYLERKLSAEVEIALISSENHFLFTPMLAEVVGRSLSPMRIAVAGRRMVRRTTWLTAQVTNLDLQGNLVSYVGAGGESASLTYDHLVLACGSVFNMNLMPGLSAYAYPLKTLGDAIYLSNDLIKRLEEASVETDPARRRKLLNIVVIGGGFSGVEVAGAMAEIARESLRFYPTLQGERPNIILLQHAASLIPEMNAPSLSIFACDKLREAGVDVRLNTGAREVTAAGVRLEGGELIEAATVVSTVGTSPNPLIQRLGLPLEHGRLVTNPDMKVKNTRNVWAIGDCAIIPNAFNNRPSSPTAQFAVRQAKQLAANLARAFDGQPTRPFSFRPLGMLASLGNRTAVAEVLGIRISGFIAWVLWRSVYLGKLPSLAHKLEVLGDWTWSALFPPNIVELKMSRTGGVGMAHYAPGEFIFHKGDPAGNIFAIQSGTAEVYLDEASHPVAILKPGDRFSADSLLFNGQGAHLVSVKAETPLDLITLRSDDFERLARADVNAHKGLQRASSAPKGYMGLMAMVKDDPRLASVKVADVMTTPVEALFTDTSLLEAIERFEGGKVGFPVTDREGVLQGYCGREELYEAFRKLSPAGARVSEFMREKPPAVTENHPLTEGILALLLEHFDLLPVVSADGSGRLVGALSPTAIAKKALLLPQFPTLTGRAAT
ncbi:MAG TPA: FAD-dependent oxidoreductase [Blastocatellia bacterium]|nr:FAD-dependent oxidoreductase [Blastocatellia bacterium]